MGRMAHLTLVMFGKALILAICGAIGDAWINFRKRRAERGLPLRQNKDGVYVPDDWAAKVEALAQGAHRFMLAVAAFWIVICLIAVAVHRFTGFNIVTAIL